MNHPVGADTADAERWWQAYELAENDQDGELRERAATGDWHAGRHLASWLSDRGKTEEAIEVIRPLADAGDDIGQLWLARWLADRDQLDELRQRAAGGGHYALIELAGWLADHECLTELGELLTDQPQQLSSWLARQHDLKVIRLAADLGEEDAQLRLARSLAHLRRRAAAGNENARQFLAEWPD